MQKRVLLPVPMLDPCGAEILSKDTADRKEQDQHKPREYLRHHFRPSRNSRSSLLTAAVQEPTHTAGPGIRGED